MKCPFRTDEKGEFMECYGKECMAYWEQLGITQLMPDGTTSNPTIKYCKKMMMPPPLSYRGCR